MSIAAINWSMEQLTDGPSAQSTLFIIADRANEHGVCRHADPDTLAQRTRQSRATIFRRLEEMERAGLLTRFTRHLDDGRREYEIRLRLDVYVNYRVDRFRTIQHLDANGEVVSEVPYAGLAGGGDGGESGTEAGAEADADDGSQIETEGGSQIETGSVSPVRLGGSQLCDSQKSPKSPESPPKPPLGSEQASKGPAGPEPDPDGLRAFKADYPRGTTKPDKVDGLWAGMWPEERLRARKGARGVRAKWEQDPKRTAVLDPWKFLSVPALWDEWARYAPPEPPARRLVIEGSREWRARAVLRVIQGRPPPKAEAAGEWRGMWVHGDVPRGLDGLADHADSDPAGWLIVRKDTAQFTAWAERLKEITGAWREARELPNWIMGLRVPCEWPPAKGSPATGPPEAA